jgi:hypothetical protein
VSTLGSLGADYLSRRLLHTNHPIGARWVDIRRIAARLALQDDQVVRDECYESYVKSLCSRVASRHDLSMGSTCLHPAHTTSRSDPYEIEDHRDHYRDYNLMSAAAYTNKLSIIEELSTDPRNLQINTGCFGNPFEMAALGGHREALSLLRSKRRAHGLPIDSTLLSSIIFARGSVDMVRDFVPENWTKSFLEADDGHNMKKLEISLCTPSLEVFQLLMDVKKSTVYPQIPETRLGSLLQRATCNGWLEMAQHLINLGAPVSHRGRSGTPRYLRYACHRGDLALAKLLLDHGASITPLDMEIAARKGRWNVVKLLVEEGADINNGDPTPLVAAVSFERADVVREFVKLGARVDGDYGQRAVKRAREDGLESMITLLGEMRADGLDQTELGPWFNNQTKPRRPWQIWK